MSEVRVLPGPLFMSDYTVRLATKQDLEVFFPILKKSLHTQFPEYTPITKDYFTDVPYTLENLHLALEQKNIYLFLAFYKTTIAGYFITYTPKSGVSMAIWLAVLDEFQHKGIATKLLALWEESAKKDGAHALQVWTNERNLDFYQKRRLTLMGKFPKAWYGVDIYMLYKIIAEPKEENYLHGYKKK